jgi:tetratricopeptide (TPR) repeat protein
VHAAVKTNDMCAAAALIDRRLQAEDAAPFRPRLLVEKAKFLYADQQHIQAQETFLAALAACEPAKTPPSEDEQRLFLALLPTYEASMDSPEALTQLLEQSEAALRSHPSYLSFEHYRAAALANSGKFIEFFDSFYRAYQARPECFLRYKTMGVLHMRLFESSSDQSCRERHRGNAVAALKQAWALQPQDGPLIVKLVFMLPTDERGAFLRTVVDGVRALRSPLARGECFFLIQQAIDVGELSVAEQLIEQAHSWYHYSRALQGLSEQLVQEQLKQ